MCSCTDAFYFCGDFIEDKSQKVDKKTKVSNLSIGQYISQCKKERAAIIRGGAIFGGNTGICFIVILRCLLISL